MEQRVENLKKEIQQILKKRPGYAETLNFYLRVREAQEETKKTARVDPVKLGKHWKKLLKKEGFSLLQREDFPIDIKASAALFHSLCKIGKEATPLMAAEVGKIEEILDHQRMDLKKLIREGGKEEKVERVAGETGLDKRILSFFIHQSRKPCIEAALEHLRHELDPESWLKGYCPVCGSLPDLSLLKEETGRRYLLCSYCGYQWRFERLLCPFCNNKGPDSLHYFCGEEEETIRIDLCESCRKYIKTIDLRVREDIDPALEDLATLHLDIVASQEGYKRPVPNLWLP